MHATIKSGSIGKTLYTKKPITNKKCPQSALVTNKKSVLKVVQFKK